MKTLYVIDMYDHSKGRCLLFFDNENLYMDSQNTHSQVYIPHDMSMIDILRFIREVLRYPEDEYDIQLFGHSNMYSNLIIPATVSNTTYPVYEIITRVEEYPFTSYNSIMRRIGDNNPINQIDLGEFTFPSEEMIHEIIEAELIEPNCNIIIQYRPNNNIKDVYLIRDGKIFKSYSNLLS